MRNDLARRVARLEGIVGKEGASLKYKLQELLKAKGYPAVYNALGALRWPGSGRAVEIENILGISVGDDYRGLEGFRGLVPDEILRRAYSLRRNWVRGCHEVRIRAGVMDEHGNVMPGYRMTENDCIVDS